ncbi:MAG: twin-arginine translocation signal domain-containing protein [Gemmatimonadaceae bacterium]|nr:twin-arginine translocation signal domain-containing protein [Gemmatimonadaceae bacterium]
MSITRRDFLKVGASAATLAAAASAPRPLLAQLGAGRAEPVPPIEDPRLEGLAARALEAAKGAGAAYADVRLTHDWTRTISVDGVGDSEVVTAGARAWVDGRWGFASGPVWSPDEMARLGREAVLQAKANALRTRRPVELAPVIAVPKGHWVMPVEIDPFEITPFEVIDYLTSLQVFVSRTPGAVVRANRAVFTKQEKAFASTAGSYLTQRTYLSMGMFAFALRWNGVEDTTQLDCLSPAGLGWELYRGQRLHDRIREAMDDFRFDAQLPVRPVEIGRYDAVFSAGSMAALLHETLGAATELDRALGYEANAGGTSYLNDPLAMLGSYQAAAPVVTITANRSEPGGAATVQWDDDGVAPDAFTLVKDGTLADFQTTRDSTAQLARYYGASAKPLPSHGCAHAPNASDAPLSRVPNLALAPGAESLDFDALVARLSTGVAVKRAQFDMDFQRSSGYGLGRIYQVKNGKRVALFATAGMLFRSPDLWKRVRAVGGAAAARRFGLASVKGEPPQMSYASVTAPPALLEQLTIIDPSRRA